MTMVFARENSLPSSWRQQNRRANAWLHTPEYQNRETFFLTVLSSGG